jgi:hypothetical protein
MTRPVLGAVAVAVALGVVDVARPAGDQWRVSIEPVASPAALASAQPQLSVQGARATLSWIESQGARAILKFAERTATGWTEPRTVSSGDNWFVNWADVPSVTRRADGMLVAHWLQKSGPSTYAYDVRLSHSSDEGRTWTPSFPPHHDGTQTEHGFASLFPMPGAGLGLVWLDGRAMKTEPHTGMEAGDMSLRFASCSMTGPPSSRGLNSRTSARTSASVASMRRAREQPRSASRPSARAAPAAIRGSRAAATSSSLRGRRPPAALRGS